MPDGESPDGPMQSPTVPLHEALDSGRSTNTLTSCQQILACFWRASSALYKLVGAIWTAIWEGLAGLRMPAFTWRLAVA